jgi:protein-disulfide isomerase
MAKKRKSAPAPGRAAKIQAAAPTRGTGPNRILIGGVVLILVIVITVAWVIIADQRTQEQASAGGDKVPAAAGEMGAGFVANKDVSLASGAPTLDIYEDFQCPVCGQFEGVFGDRIDQLASEGKLKLVYHFKTIIDANVGNDASLRAAIGTLCAADEGKFTDYHHLVFANQPPNEGDGWTDEQLSAFAEDAGVSGAQLDSWQQCFDARSYSQYVQSTEEASAKKGINATPTVLLAGDKVDFGTVNTPDALTKAVEDATQ